jgi:hypothetical protein
MDLIAVPLSSVGVVGLDSDVENYFSESSLQFRRSPPPVTEDARSFLFVEMLNHDPHCTVLLYAVVSWLYSDLWRNPMFYREFKCRWCRPRALNYYMLMPEHDQY